MEVVFLYFSPSFVKRQEISGESSSRDQIERRRGRVCFNAPRNMVTRFFFFFGLSTTFHLDLILSFRFGVPASAISLHQFPSPEELSSKDMMSGTNCYWKLLAHDGSGTLESAASEAATAPAALAREASLSSSDEDETPPSPLPHLFHLFDAALRGFLTSARCLTRVSERYSVEARSLASSGRVEEAFNFLGRALEVSIFVLLLLVFFLLLSSLSHGPLSSPSPCHNSNPRPPPSPRR